jgi:non-heme chloroperoxidase
LNIIHQSSLLFFTMPRFTAPSDGTQLFYRDYRPTTSPSPYRPANPVSANTNNSNNNHAEIALVMLHGSPMSSVMFESIMLRLCESYRIRCVAPDRRGFGKSDWDSSSTLECTEATLAGDVAGLVEKLRLGPFIFVGSSLGAPESVLAHGMSVYIRENCKVIILMTFILLSPLFAHLLPGVAFVAPS